MLGSDLRDFKFSFTAEALPDSNVRKVLQIPELLDMICNAVSNVSNSPWNQTYNFLDEAEETIRQLRLVSRAFRNAADTYFIVKIHSINACDSYGCTWDKRAEHISEKIVACGPYIRKINLDDDNEEALKAAAEHCTNVREVSLVFQEMPGCSVCQGDYRDVLGKWASLPHSKLETVNAIMALEDAEGKAVFTDFDSVRQYFRDIKTLNVKCSNPNEHHTVEIRDQCCTPIKWKRFLSFLTYFCCLESLEFTGFFIDWKEMPARVLDPFSLKPLELRSLTNLDIGLREVELSVVFRLNRLLPCLETLTLGQITSQNLELEDWGSTYEDDSDNPDGDYEIDEDGDESESANGQDTTPSSDNSRNLDGHSIAAANVPPSALATASAPAPNERTTTKTSPHKVLPVFDYESSVHVKSTLSFERLLVTTAHVADLAELSKWAPKLESLTCLETVFFGDPNKNKEDKETALGPLNDRAWDTLDLRGLGRWEKRELDEYLHEAMVVGLNMF